MHSIRKYRQIHNCLKNNFETLHFFVLCLGVLKLQSRNVEFGLDGDSAETFFRVKN